MSASVIAKLNDEFRADPFNKFCPKKLRYSAGRFSGWLWTA